jgi:ribA/ribD-fused uncharacterized protein
MLATSVDDLLTLRDSAYAMRFLFFWGHQPQRDGGVGAGCLSQWWEAPFEVDGRRYATAEHFMMWSKAMLFGDEAVAAEILAARHPGAAKALGREVKGFDQPVWERERSGIVVAGSFAKFSQHADLKAFLLAGRGRPARRGSGAVARPQPAGLRPDAGPRAPGRPERRGLHTRALTRARRPRPPFRAWPDDPAMPREVHAPAPAGVAPHLKVISSSSRDGWRSRSQFD